MLVGGYSMADKGFAIEVDWHEAGQSFLLQGDEAEQFRKEWKEYQGENFSDFLFELDYFTLFY